MQYSDTFFLDIEGYISEAVSEYLFLAHNSSIMKDILAIGNALVDIITVLDSDAVIKTLGYPKGSMQLTDVQGAEKVNALTTNCKKIMTTGGSASNTIHGLAKLGLQTGYIGKIGNDDLGRFFSDDFKKEGVNTYLEYSGSPTGHSTALVTPDSERTFATFLGAAAEMATLPEGEKIMTDYRMIHIEGYLVFNHELIKEIITKARKAGLKISVDLASFNVVEANLDFLHEVIPGNVDILFANEEEAKAFTGKDPEYALEEIATLCDIGVVKIGSKGSFVKQRDKKYKAGVIPVKAIDTTGAGDQYAAGFLYGLMKNFPLSDCAKMGALLAGKVIEDYGARIKDEKWDSIREEINNIISP